MSRLPTPEVLNICQEINEIFMKHEVQVVSALSIAMTYVTHIIFTLDMDNEDRINLIDGLINALTDIKKNPDLYIDRDLGTYTKHPTRE